MTSTDQWSKSTIADRQGISRKQKRRLPERSRRVTARDCPRKADIYHVDPLTIDEIAKSTELPSSLSRIFSRLDLTAAGLRRDQLVEGAEAFNQTAVACSNHSARRTGPDRQVRKGHRALGGERSPGEICRKDPGDLRVELAEYRNIGERICHCGGLTWGDSTSRFKILRAREPDQSAPF